MNLTQIIIDKNKNNKEFDELTYNYCIKEILSLKNLAKYLNSKKYISMKQNIFNFEKNMLY